MRFTFADSLINPDFYIPLAQAAENAGYDSFAVPDNIGFVKDADTKYPYTADGGRDFLEGKPFIEPFTLIPALGAVTSKLRFTTLVVKLPIRPPYLIAKSAASVAVMTQNRFIFGIGLSPWPEDYVICQQEWKARGKRMDEMITIMKGLWTGDFFSHQGEFYDIPEVKMQPVPSEPIPLLIGGHSEAALKRAARIGDGWMHAGGDPEELQSLINRLQQLRQEYGREKEPFEIHVISADAYSEDGVKRLQDMGVTDAIVGFRNVYQMEQDTQTLEKKVDDLSRFADNIIAKVKS